MSADTAYDAVMMLAEGITRAKTFSTDVVKKELLNLDYAGASGKIHFDSKGGVRKPPDIYIVKEGARTRLGSAEELVK